MNAVVNKWGLVLATVGRYDDVATFFAALEKQSSAAIEVVVVDQNDDGMLDALIDQWSKVFSIVHLKPGKVGVSVARNIGMENLSDSQYVAFPDDDCFYFSETLQRVEDAFQANDHVDCLVASWLSESDASCLPYSGERLEVTGSPQNTLRATPTHVHFYRNTDHFRTCRFDPQLGPGGGTPWLCGEDSDFLLLASKNGQLLLGLHLLDFFTRQLPIDLKVWP